MTFFLHFKKKFPQATGFKITKEKLLTYTIPRKSLMQADCVQLSCLGKVGEGFKVEKQSKGETLITVWIIWRVNGFPWKKPLMHVLFWNTNGTVLCKRPLGKGWSECEWKQSGLQLEWFPHICTQHPSTTSITHQHSLLHLWITLSQEAFFILGRPCSRSLIYAGTG